MNVKEYVVYKGESFVCIGTIKECAQHIGVLPATVYFYRSSTYKKRVAERKKARNYITVTKLEED
ncbi:MULTISPECIES: hypothetical protein [Bacillus cereus group]|uniref:hypothetical protein n=1 Tax=Bacillus cereus group TaxID=86661 RepID=UPI00062D5E70|nr:MULTISPECIES: hypothetical protein [Bacillus cereus group]MED2795517.1 hypothetical protein [Bacillus wiedmannii]